MESSLLMQCSLTAPDSKYLSISDPPETLVPDGDNDVKAVHELKQACQFRDFESSDLIDVADKDDVTEPEIESNFTSYRPYIESCVKIMDLLFFFKLFTRGFQMIDAFIIEGVKEFLVYCFPDEAKKLFRMSKFDPEMATRLAFDAIVEMKHVPDRFLHLLCALREAEYPKLVDLLKGLLIRAHDTDRKKLKIFAKDIYQRLSVSDVLPHLLTKKVLNAHDIEEIKTSEKNDSRASAVMHLLSILPNRSKNWFEQFLETLLESSQRALAMIIDRDTTKKLEERNKLGVVTPLGESSLQVSVKGLKKYLAYKKSLSDTELFRAESAGNTEQMKVPLASSESSGQKTKEAKKELEERNELGVVTPLGELALQVSVKGRKKYLEYKNILSDYESNKAESTGNEDQMKVPSTPSEISGQKTNEIKEELISSTSYILKSEADRRKETINNETQAIECNPCKKKECVVTAQYFCTDCCESLCGSCEEVHRRLRITQNHKVMMTHSMNLTASYSQSNFTTLHCSRHPSQKVEYYCREHEDLVCSSEFCLKNHEFCEIILITELSDLEIEGIQAITMKKRKKMCDRIRELKHETEAGLTMLKCSAETCKKNICDFADDLQTSLADLRKTALEKLSKYEEEHKLKINGCVEICKMLEFYLASRVSPCEISKQIGDTFTIFVNDVKMNRILKIAERVLDAIEESQYSSPIMFHRNASVEEVTNVEHLGTFEFSASSKEGQQKIADITKNLQDVIDLVERDGSETKIEGPHLENSLATETSFLKPYFHFIQQSSSGTYNEWEIVENFQ